MPSDTSSQKNILLSRIIHWGILFVFSSTWVVITFFPLPDDISFLYYIIVFLVFNTIFLVYLNEIDYPKNNLTFEANCLIQGELEIRLSEITQLDWISGIFPGKDLSGCEIYSLHSKIQVLFKHLDELQTLKFINLLRKKVPIDQQKGWSSFCHHIALALYFKLKHPKRDLPEPTMTETLQIEQRNKLRSRLLNIILITGIVLSVTLYFTLHWLGISDGIAIPSAVGLAFIGRVFAQLYACYKHSRFERNFIESKHIWHQEVEKNEEIQKELTFDLL